MRSTASLRNFGPTRIRTNRSRLCVVPEHRWSTSHKTAGSGSKTFTSSAIYLAGIFSPPATETGQSVMIELRNLSGRSDRATVMPSYSHKPQAVANLIAGLQSLQIIPHDQKPDTQIDTWSIHERGCALFKHVSLALVQASEAEILEQIALQAESLEHDPHVQSSENLLSIAVTTHQPPGLSMKDVKLAKAIDTILAKSIAGETVSHNASQYDKQKVLSELSTDLINTATNTLLGQIAQARECGCDKFAKR